VRVPVLTAVTDAVWEAELVEALDRRDLGVDVVRRCVDLADLLATAAAGTARAVLVSADLRRLDRDALSRLAVAGVAVVGLVPPGDEDAERRLRQLGVLHVLAADAGPLSISAAVVEAVSAALTPRSVDAGAPAEPRLALPELPTEPTDPETDPDLAAGVLIAVWGPAGAPGRTTVAVGVAAELAAGGTDVLLVDADVYGGVVGQALGLLDEAPGLAAATRLANGGTLDLAALAGLARLAAPGLRVLTGISRAERWPELRPAAIAAVLDLARRLAPVTVVDCGFCLEQDEELVYDTTAPRRNGATVAVLEAADTVLAVGSADPVSLQRLVRGLTELRAVAPAIDPQVVVNRVRRGVVRGNPEAEIRAALRRYAGVEQVSFVPLDQAGMDAALAAGRTLPEAAADSPARVALAELAGVVTHSPARLSRPRHRAAARRWPWVKAARSPA
jgi:MinD-like ATPase involved in chromosome partitioning or flagellar assembly